MSDYKKISILGMGLLGASLTISVRKYFKNSFISAWSNSASSRDTARKMRIANCVCDKIEDSVKDADIIIICTNPKYVSSIAKEILPYLKSGAIVSDVASVKEEICNDCKKIFAKSKAVFIGSHPMAGSEKSGAKYAIKDLFKDKPCIVIDSKNKKSLKKLESFWTTLGMNVKIIPAKIHDEVVATISHLPHISASALCINALQNKKSHFAISTGFKDTSRIASGDINLWQDILLQNKKAVLKSISNYKKILCELEKSLESADAKKVATFLKKGKDFRDSLLKK